MADDSLPHTTTRADEARPWRDPEIWLLGLFLLISAVVYYRTTIVVVRWNDPAAYALAAQQIAETGLPAYYDDNNIRVGPYFTPHGFGVWRGGGDPYFYPTYAIGLPLLLAVAKLIAPGSPAYLYVLPTLGLLGLVFTFGLGRTLFGRWVGLLAAGLLAFAPDYWLYSTEIWSDVAAATFLVGGTLFSIRSVRRASILQGLLAGALLGYACLIRYPSVLALLPLGVYLVVAERATRKAPAALASQGIVLGAFFAGILAYNWTVYGHPLNTGYAPRFGWVPWPIFSWQNFVGNSPVAEGGYRSVLQALWRNAGVWLSVAVAGLILMPRARALLLGGNILVFSLAYAAYLWPSLDARFLIFVLPMVYLAASFFAVWVVHRLLPASRWLVPASVILLLLLWQLSRWSTASDEVSGRNRSGQNTVAWVAELAQATEPDAVFLSHRYHDLFITYGQRSALYYGLLAPADEAMGNYQLAGYDDRLVAVVTALLERDTPIYMVQEPENLRFRQGPIDPFPVLSTQFSLEQIRSDPPVYRVELRP